MIGGQSQPPVGGPQGPRDASVFLLHLGGPKASLPPEPEAQCPPSAGGQHPHLWALVSVGPIWALHVLILPWRVTASLCLSFPVLWGRRNQNTVDWEAPGPVCGSMGMWGSGGDVWTPLGSTLRGRGLRTGRWGQASRGGRHQPGWSHGMTGRWQCGWGAWASHPGPASPSVWEGDATSPLSCSMADMSQDWLPGAGVAQGPAPLPGPGWVWAQEGLCRRRTPRCYA